MREVIKRLSGALLFICVMLAAVRAETSPPAEMLGDLALVAASGVLFLIWGAVSND